MYNKITDDKEIMNELVMVSRLHNLVIIGDLLKEAFYPSAPLTHKSYSWVVMLKLRNHHPQNKEKEHRRRKLNIDSKK